MTYDQEMTEIDGSKHAKFFNLKLHFLKIPMESESVALYCAVTLSRANKNQYAHVRSAQTRL